MAKAEITLLKGQKKRGEVGELGKRCQGPAVEGGQG